MIITHVASQKKKAMIVALLRSALCNKCWLKLHYSHFQASKYKWGAAELQLCEWKVMALQVCASLRLVDCSFPDVLNSCCQNCSEPSDDPLNGLGIFKRESSVEDWNLSPCFCLYCSCSGHTRLLWALCFALSSANVFCYTMVNYKDASERCCVERHVNRLWSYLPVARQTINI